MLPGTGAAPAPVLRQAIRARRAPHSKRSMESSPHASPTLATGLRCLRCGRRYRFDPAATVCVECGTDEADAGLLEVEYDYPEARRLFPLAAVAGIFRYRALLPAGEIVPTLPTGATPMLSVPRLAARWGLRALYLKDDTRNPVRCLEDRASALAVNLAAARGTQTLYVAGAGDVAVSLAGFCAYAGLDGEIWLPASAPAADRRWLERFGAHVHAAAGDAEQAAAEAEAAGRREGWYARSPALNPFLLEGSKTVAFEIAEQRGWQLPDLVVAPAGDGGVLSALGKGFRELRLLGRTESLPRLVGVQAEAVQPLLARWEGRAEPEPGLTRAAALAVPRPYGALRLFQELELSRGRLLAVDDAALETARGTLGREAGVLVDLASAAPLAALDQLAREETLADQVVVLVLAGGRVDGE